PARRSPRRRARGCGAVRCGRASGIDLPVRRPARGEGPLRRALGAAAPGVLRRCRSTADRGRRRGRSYDGPRTLTAVPPDRRRAGAAPPRRTPQEGLTDLRRRPGLLTALSRRIEALPRGVQFALALIVVTIVGIADELAGAEVV